MTVRFVHEAKLKKTIWILAIAHESRRLATTGQSNNIREAPFTQAMPTTPEKLDLRSMDVAADKRRLLRQLFPEVFTESTDTAGNPAEIDFEKLKAVLGEHATIADPAAERYGLDWPGKRDALKAVQTPALGTLVPCPEESVDWDSTKNVFIEGDNLEVLKLLQKSYYGKVKMIYIDPPYNTGNDFVYPDNYAESLDTYLRFTGQISGEGIKLTTNSKDSGRFHSNWLRMMYPRLYDAKNLLREDGVILISIDDSEARNLRKICDQIFGEENFLAQFAGSASAAEGIYRLNLLNDSKRNFICVQLPEPIDSSSEAGLQGYATIADLAKERIRRAGSKIREEWEAKHGSREDAKTRRNEDEGGEDLFSESKTLRAFAPSRETSSTIFPPDLGFRVFKLAPSNFKRWDGEAAAESVDALEQQLEANLDHLAAEATEESILFEILLKAGFELTCPVEKLELVGLPVISVEDGALLLCLADRITPALIDAVAAHQPIQFICLDRALHGGDALKVNALETFRACQPEIQFRTV